MVRLAKCMLLWMYGLDLVATVALEDQYGSNRLSQQRVRQEHRMLNRHRAATTAYATLHHKTRQQSSDVTTVRNSARHRTSLARQQGGGGIVKKRGAT